LKTEMFFVLAFLNLGIVCISTTVVAIYSPSTYAIKDVCRSGSMYVKGHDASEIAIYSPSTSKVLAGCEIVKPGPCHTRGSYISN
jgi:hypothetical protein